MTIKSVLKLKSEGSDSNSGYFSDTSICRKEDDDKGIHRSKSYSILEKKMASNANFGDDFVLVEQGKESIEFKSFFFGWEERIFKEPTNRYLESITI